MTRLRLMVTVEYEVQNALETYGTEDPYEMSKIDEESISADYIAELIDVAVAEDDGTCVIRVFPV